MINFQTWHFFHQKAIWKSTYFSSNIIIKRYMQSLKITRFPDHPLSWKNICFLKTNLKKKHRKITIFPGFLGKPRRATASRSHEGPRPVLTLRASKLEKSQVWMGNPLYMEDSIQCKWNFDGKTIEVNGGFSIGDRRLRRTYKNLTRWKRTFLLDVICSLLMILIEVWHDWAGVSQNWHNDTWILSDTENIEIWCI